LPFWWLLELLLLKQICAAERTIELGLQTRERRKKKKEIIVEKDGHASRKASDLRRRKRQDRM
jgi:hypothetical protein